MGIALLSLRQAEKVEPQLKVAIKNAATPASARERLALRDGDLAPGAGALTARQYVQQLGIMEQEATRSQMVWALGRIEPGELETMVKSLARMRGRYASLVLEYSQSDRPIGHVALDELRGLRERIQEFELGLETIKTAILDGTAEVAGVKTATL